MPTYLFSIENVFHVPSRGVVIAPSSATAVRYNTGQYIELRRPDGTSLRALIQGIELLNFALDVPQAQHVRPILLAEELAVEELPKETTVWLLDGQ